MYIQELFDHLAYGEFSDTRLVDEATGSMKPAFIPKIISFTNLGLLDLYKRFLLLKKKITLYEYAGKSLYYLRPANTVRIEADIDDTTYLLDSIDYPFETDELFKIIEVFDVDDVEVPLNNPANKANGVFTDAFDILTMKPVDTGVRVLTLWYQARYPVITYNADLEEFDPADYVLYIPPFLLQALLYFIGSQFFKGKVAKTTEAGKPQYNTFEYLYEIECRKIAQEGFAEEITTNRDRFTANKFI